MYHKLKYGIATVAVLVMVLCMAGCGEKVVLTEETAVETEAIGKTFDGDYESVIELMAESDATFFYVEGPDENGEWTVYQTDKATFCEKEILKEDEAVSIITDTFSTFLNTAYDGIGVTYGQSTSQGGTIFAGMGTWGSGEEIDAEFNGSLAGYFEDHQLELSCEDYTIKKIGIRVHEYYNDIEAKDEIEYRYFFIGDGNTMTINAVGDMSDLGYFADAGESRLVTLSGTVAGYDWCPDLALDYMYIE